ncbi:MAG TPA: hypothetical protein DEH03_02075, partial [Brevundimonas sp.]|nr:hypothetical protein [Brevundimonas sp.]
WKAPAPRPPDARLDSRRIAADFGVQSRDWRDAAPGLAEAWLKKDQSR